MFKFIKCLAAAACLSYALSGTAFADDKADLKAKLNAFNEFSASFVQEVTDKSGQEVMCSNGIIALQKPAKFMLHTLNPDEQVLFCAGNDIYFYDPFVNQVSIFSRSELSASPFILLSDMSDNVWANYDVRHENGVYIITPNRQGDIVNLRLSFKGSDIDTISLVMKDGNINTYKLSDGRRSADPQVFEYKIPEDAEVDDERR